MGDSLVAQMVKRLPVMRETRVQSLGWEDPPLEKDVLDIVNSATMNIEVYLSFQIIFSLDIC